MLQVTKQGQDVTELLVSAIENEESLSIVMPESYKTRDAKNERFGRL